VEHFPGGACTHWESAACSRRTTRAVGDRAKLGVPKQPLAAYDTVKEISMPRVRSTLLLTALYAAGPAFAAGDGAIAPCDAVAAPVKSITANSMIFDGNSPFDPQALFSPLVNIPRPQPVDQESPEFKFGKLILCFHTTQVDCGLSRVIVRAMQFQFFASARSIRPVLP
jgi:hypothetical protein